MTLLSGYLFCVLLFYLKVLSRLNQLGLAVNPSKAAKIVKELGEEHDSEVLQWKTLAEEGVAPSESISQAGRDQPGTDSNPDTESQGSASDDSSDEDWEEVQDSSSLSSK